MERKIKKLQLNKETIARLDQSVIYGGEAEHSVNHYKCVYAEQTAIAKSDLIAAACGDTGIVTDDCGFTGHTNNTVVNNSPCWGHECW